MREWLFFSASLGAAAVLAAVAVICPPISPIWKYLLWTGSFVFAFSTLLLFNLLHINLLHKLFSKKEKKPTKNIEIRSPEISIIIGYGSPYEDAKIENTVNTTRIVSIGVKNIGNTPLSNCKLHYEVRDPATNVSQSWLRRDSFFLNPDQEEYIDLASYGEPADTTQGVSPLIQLHAPPGFGYGVRPPTLPATGGAITLIAESSESRPCKVVLHLWVKEGKLHWDKV